MRMVVRRDDSAAAAVEASPKGDLLVAEEAEVEAAAAAKAMAAEEGIAIAVELSGYDVMSI